MVERFFWKAGYTKIVFLLIIHIHCIGLFLVNIYSGKYLDVDKRVVVIRSSTLVLVLKNLAYFVD